MFGDVVDGWNCVQERERQEALEAAEREGQTRAEKLAREEVG